MEEKEAEEFVKLIDEGLYESQKTDVERARSTRFLHCD